MLITDLNNCDLEPIHIPGKIQSHGFLVAVDEYCNICFLSENLSKFIKIDPIGLIGQSIDSLETYFSKHKSFPGYLRQYILLSDQQEPGRKITTVIEIDNVSYNLIISRSFNNYILEFEPENSNLQTDVQQQVGSSLSEMLADKKLDQLLHNTANQVRQIIGYDRVMIYKFHKDGHGEVVAESKSDTLETWIGYHYPASDIPKQARELYKKNLIRLIADVHTEPAALLTTAAGSSGTELDLTFSELRAVSPIHIQYLKNMGVASSFSVSLLDQDNLWGLIACHNYTSRFINHKQRESAKLIGQVLSSAISFRQQEEDQQKIALARQTIESITRHLLRNVPVDEALFGEMSLLQSAVDSTGAVLRLENQFHSSGDVPDEQFLNKLTLWLGLQSKELCFHTDRLGDLFPDAKRYKSSATGLLACRLSADLNEYVLWFRPELIETINWAGQPEKDIQVDEQGMTHISPRHSFAASSQQVGETAKSWAEFELEAATQIKDEINYSINRKATELRILNEKLREAYAELDTFSYTISHDLKNPLTTIKSFSQLIYREAMGNDRVQQMSTKILNGVEKMQYMIEEVLRYSRIGQEKVTMKAVNMQKLLDDLRSDLIVSSNNPNLQIKIGHAPDVQGDELMILQVFSNLVGNAVKYSSRVVNPFVEISGYQNQDHIIYEISDNGIGIDSNDHSAIFELFSRSAGGVTFEGTGVGLAIVKRILEKHQGEIWLESETGFGTTFFVKFKHYEVAASLN